MQQVSKEYIESMKQPIRNRGYIKVSIGIVNSDAQDNAVVDTSKTDLVYSDPYKLYRIFDGDPIEAEYATAEQDFSRVDGTMRFTPPLQIDKFFYGGVITKDILGSVYISFGELSGLDIKGLTIQFGDCYPSQFTIEADSGTKTYTNRSALFTTEDAFDGTSFLIIKPNAMVNGQGRLRIYRMTFGIANVFSNSKVKNCAMKEYVSPVSETVPSKDVSLVIDNQNLYYSVDNPESAIAYMDIGQEVKIAYGYDVTGNGDIEWLPETVTHLSSWKADDAEAEFTATDRFYQLGDTYYGGVYRSEGITLYNLALEVLKSAGIEDEEEYYIDPYLRNIVVYNPLPVAKHSEELQIIANAGRCALYEDRQSRIHIKSSFVPEMSVSANNSAPYSNANNLINGKEKMSYATASQDFSAVDGSLWFTPESPRSYLVGYMGYTSDSVSDENGNFDTNPIITIALEAGFSVYGLAIKFRNTAPKEFVIRTYLNAYFEERLVDTFTVADPDLEYFLPEWLELFDRVEIEFTKGYPNSRVFVDNIVIGESTNYNLTRNNELTGSPKGERQKKIKNISVKKTNYRESQDNVKELVSETITLDKDSEYLVYFTYPSYGLDATIKDNDSIAVRVIDSSNYYAKLKFTGIQQETEINFSVSGYEYVVDESYLKVNHNPNGEELEWNNPLISTEMHAKELEEWLASYYLGDVDYEISWRGDPRVEANDLFYLELKNGMTPLIRSYQNELEFNGAWSGIMKARKVVT